MSKYKVMSSIGNGKEFMNGIEFDYIIDDMSIGAKANLFGETFTVTQNGQIIVLVNNDWALTIMEMLEEKREVKETLEINKNIDIFFETKEIEVRKNCTYKDIFDVLSKEWNVAKAIMPEAFPLEYDDKLKLLNLRNGWSFSDGSLSHIREGSFSMIDKNGRHV